MSLRSNDGLTRRSLLAGAAALAAARPGLSNAKERELVLWGPPAGPSVTLVHAIARGALRPVADKVSFRAWRNPDELRAGLTSKTMDLFVLPTQVAANLYNRGLDVRLVNVMTNGLLYVVSEDPSIARVSDLKGRKIAVPFRNDTPDLLFQRLLSAQGLSPETDLTLQFTGTPIEAIQLLVTGRLDAALVPEPAASAAILRAAVSGKDVARVIDIQKAWAEATGAAPVLPQAGLGVAAAFLESRASLVEALRQALIDATASVNADPAAAASDAAAVLEMPWPVLEKSIPYSNLVATPARQARPSLEGMFAALAEIDPRVIGGGLPPADFYL